MARLGDYEALRPSRSSSFPIGLRLANDQENRSEYAKKAERWDGEGSETTSEPQLEHRHVIARPPLKYSDGTPSCNEECDPLGGENGDGHPKPGVASSSQGAEPKMPEAGKLAEPNGAVEQSQAMSTLAEWIALRHHHPQR